MSLNLIRQVGTLFIGDGIQTVVSFDLRDTGATLVSPPLSVLSVSAGVTVVAQSRYQVTLSFDTPPTTAGSGASLQLFY